MFDGSVLTAWATGGTRSDGTVRMLLDAATRRRTVCSEAVPDGRGAAVVGRGPEPLATSDCTVMAPRARATRTAPRPTLAQRIRRSDRAWRTGFSTTT